MPTRDEDGIQENSLLTQLWARAHTQDELSYQAACRIEALEHTLELLTKEVKSEIRGTTLNLAVKNAELQLRWTK